MPPKMFGCGVVVRGRASGPKEQVGRACLVGSTWFLGEPRERRYNSKQALRERERMWDIIIETTSAMRDVEMSMSRGPGKPHCANGRGLRLVLIFTCHAHVWRREGDEATPTLCQAREVFFDIDATQSARAGGNGAWRSIGSSKTTRGPQTPLRYPAPLAAAVANSNIRAQLYGGAVIRPATS